MYVIKSNRNTNSYTVRKINRVTQVVRVGRRGLDGETGPQGPKGDKGDSAPLEQIDALGQKWGSSMAVNGQLEQVPILDNVARRIRNEVAIFSRWLAKTGDRGVMSEVGSPWYQDLDDWNRVLAEMYRGYYKSDIPVIPFTAQGNPGRDDGLFAMYTRSTGTFTTTGMDLARPNAVVPEAFMPKTGAYMGIDVFGGTANDGGGSGTPGIMNNSDPGTYGVDWWYEPQTTYDYLASRGYTVARIGFKMERLFPSLWGGLEPNELARLKEQVLFAKNAGMKVVLDCHNYAIYVTASGVLSLNTNEYPIAALVDFWDKLSDAFKDVEGVSAYSLMNEPHSVQPGYNGESPARMWEVASQMCVDAIRANGDSNEIHVSVYEWGHLPWVSKNHRKGWIKDPLNNFRYEGHHYPYFNRLTAANYPDSYADELSLADGTWINQMNTGVTYADLADLTYNELP